MSSCHITSRGSSRLSAPDSLRSPLHRGVIPIGAMNMKLQTSGIDHVNLQVRDLDESCKFWHDLLGFDVLEDMPSQRGRIIGSSKAKLALYENPNLCSDHEDGFSHVSFHIENFDEIEKHCAKLGIEIKYNGTVQWPKSRSVYISDPNGYEVELAEKWGGGL